jgi:GNAT superfamily N-acetyltransferase
MTGSGDEAAHRLAGVLRAAAAGRFPEPDGEVEVVPPLGEGLAGVVCLTGHAMVATTVTLARLRGLGADGFGGSLSGPVLRAIAGRDGEIGVEDVLLVASGTGWTTLPERSDLDGHPRVAFARRWRDGVHVHGDDRGLVTISTGLAGLPELSFEVTGPARGRGYGRALLREGLGLVPEGEPVLVSVAAGNAASLRAVLAAGFTPIGSVRLVRPRRVTGRARQPAGRPGR